MTVDPTALQQARLHIGQMRVCWPMLGDARTARVSRPSVALSGRAAAMRDEDLRAERADRDAAVSYRALAASPAPLALGVLDAELLALQTLAWAAWDIRSDLRHWSKRVPRWPMEADEQLTWLTGMLEQTTSEVVARAAVDLRTAAISVARAVGHELADDWKPTGGRCPCCGQRAIHMWALSSDRCEHTLECTGQRDDGKPCRCDGDGCPCGRAGARAGSKHLWPA